MEQQQKPLSVFVSHSKDDAAFARHLTQYLQEAKVRVWLAEAELAVGDSIVESVDTAIRGTDLLIAVVSRASLEAKWFRYEIERAQRNPDLAIIFVSIDGSALAPPLEKFPCIRGADEADFPYDDLLEQIRRRFPDASDFEQPDDSIPEVPTMVGRDGALHRLEEMIAQNRIVAITGMAGIGKTTMAAATARWARDTQLVQRVVWVHGNHLNEAGFVAELQRALKVPEPGVSTETAMSLIVSSLQSTSTLIVVDDASNTSLEILNRIPHEFGHDGLHVLVTSRTRNLPGAQRDYVTLDLNTLTEDEAMAFLEKMLDEHQKKISNEDARGIVTATGGHPLVLSLIAGQLQTGATPSAVLQNLRSDPSHPAHNASIKQTLDYTYDTLSQEERHVLSAIAEFGDSSVSIRTVSMLVGIRDTSDVLRRVEGLAARGVVSLDGDRVSTHPLIREYLKQLGDHSESAPHTLYITVDPELMAKEDFVEFLDALNVLYTQLGGDELIICEDEIGRFTKTGVLV